MTKNYNNFEDFLALDILGHSKTKILNNGLSHEWTHERSSRKSEAIS